MDATPAPNPAPHETPAAVPASRILTPRQHRAAEKLVGAWCRLYSLFKAAEKKVDAARDKVTAWAIDAGVEVLETKHGTLKLQTREEVGWKAIAESVIKPEFLEQLKPQFTTKSKPYFRALPSWGAK